MTVALVSLGPFTAHALLWVKMEPSGGVMDSPPCPPCVTSGLGLFICKQGVRVAGLQRPLQVPLLCVRAAPYAIR